MGKRIQEHVEYGEPTSFCWRCYSVAALLVMLQWQEMWGRIFYCVSGGWRKEMRCESLEVCSSGMEE